MEVAKVAAGNANHIDINLHVLEIMRRIVLPFPSNTSMWRDFGYEQHVRKASERERLELSTMLLPPST